MPRESLAERNRKQRARQQEIRDAQRENKRPGRDDIARATLYWMITQALDKSTEERLEMMQAHIVDLLSSQGFDEAASFAVFDDLIEKYKDGRWRFRRKVHLIDKPDDLDLDF
jgi:hypothetical protein